MEFLELHKSSNSRSHFQGVTKMGCSRLRIFNYLNFCGFLELLGLGREGMVGSPCPGGSSKTFGKSQRIPSCLDGEFQVIQDLFPAQIPESSLGEFWGSLSLLHCFKTTPKIPKPTKKSPNEDKREDFVLFCFVFLENPPQIPLFFLKLSQNFSVLFLCGAPPTPYPKKLIKTQFQQKKGPQKAK